MICAGLKNYGPLFGSDFNRDHSILGYVLGSHVCGKPHRMELHWVLRPSGTGSGSPWGRSPDVGVATERRLATQRVRSPVI